MDVRVTSVWRLCGVCVTPVRDPREDVFGLASDGPTGIVGPCKISGAVMHLRKGAPPFILAYFKIFFLVGLCSL